MTAKSESAIADHVVHAVQTVAEFHARSEQGVNSHQRVIEKITLALGRPGAVYLVSAAIASWLALNTSAGRSAWDPPPFSGLATVTSIVALLTTIVILTSQNRQTRAGEQRAQLDLHVNLMAEEKTAKIIQLLEELRRDMPNVKDRVDLRGRRHADDGRPGHGNERVRKDS